MKILNKNVLYIIFLSSPFLNFYIITIETYLFILIVKRSYIEFLYKIDTNDHSCEVIKVI